MRSCYCKRWLVCSYCGTLNKAHTKCRCSFVQYGSLASHTLCRERKGLVTGLFPLRQFPLCKFPLRQFPFGQLPTSPTPTLSIPIWSMLTKWELTKGELYTETLKNVILSIRTRNTHQYLYISTWKLKCNRTNDASFEVRENDRRVKAI